MTTHRYTIVISTLAFTVACSQAFAVPTQVRHQDAPDHCDLLSIPFDVDEIGLSSIFPADESLDFFSPGATSVSPCPDHDSPDEENIEVAIFNASGRDFGEVWYVADPETKISNFDGYSNDAAFPTNPGWFAFRLDHDVSDPGGIHHPLIFESMTVDGIWQDGEEWRFVLQDYSNANGLPAEAFLSIGVGSASTDVPPILSSGSIIALPIPEPTSISLFCLALTTFVFTRR